MDNNPAISTEDFVKMHKQLTADPTSFKQYDVMISSDTARVGFNIDDEDETRVMVETKQGKVSLSGADTLEVARR